jgi:hypothetical protein
MLTNQTEYDQVFKNNFEKFVNSLKKQKKILAIEYRHFSNNTRNRSHFFTGTKTKSRETFDYKIKFHHGNYSYIEPNQKGKNDTIPANITFEEWN